PMPPRISVVVPIYNVEAYLEPCLESLAAQTHTDFEAVLVDDGSTDGSAAIAEAFAQRDPRFRLVRQPNGGLSRARNTGIDHAKGEFLAFLDSDDMLPPNAYELLLGALDSTGSDFASGNVAEHGPRGAKRWYEETVVADDLRLHLNILDRADEAYRELFFDRVNAYLDTVDRRVFAPLPAIDRLKWHLARRRLMPELV